MARGGSGAHQALMGFVYGAILILVGSMLAWLVGIIATNWLINSTGGYDSPITATLAPLLTPLLIALAVIAGLIVIVLSAVKAVSNQ